MQQNPKSFFLDLTIATNIRYSSDTNKKILSDAFALGELTGVSHIHLLTSLHFHDAAFEGVVICCDCPRFIAVEDPMISTDEPQPFHTHILPTSNEVVSRISEQF
jgi:hypothetical protein